MAASPTFLPTKDINQRALPGCDSPLTQVKGPLTHVKGVRPLSSVSECSVG